MSYAEGIDISTFQYPTPTLTGLSFVVVRAGYGSSAVDPRYAYHAANVRAAGLVLGAYWFWYYGQDNAAAVSTFLATAGAADLLFLDLEGTNANTAAGLASATDFIAKVHAAGREIGLYHSLSGYPNLGQDINWPAYWSTIPPDGSTGYKSVAWDFWQYGSTTIDGKSIDGDRFHGDAAALEAFVGTNINPAIDLPVASAKIAATPLYADRAGTQAISKTWAGGSNIGVYSHPAAGSSNTAMPHGPVAILVGLGSAPYTPTICWVDSAAVTIIDSTPYDSADLTTAKQAQYDLDAASIAATAKLTNPRPS